MPNFDRIAAPSNKKLRKGQFHAFPEETEDEIPALDTLKGRLVEPGLALPRSQGAYTVDTEAFDKQTGCVFLHKPPNGTDDQIEYLPRSWNDYRYGYDTTHCEFRAVVLAVLLL